MTPKGDVLCIHYYYPPIRSGGVVRNYFMSKAFASQFDRVHVISTSNADIMEQEPMDMPDNIVIYYAKTSDFRSIRRTGNHIKESTKENPFFQFLLKLKKTLPFHFYLGEGGQQYIHNAIKIAGEIIINNDIQLIYSSFMPYADHKVASMIKQKQKNIPWVADFRDLQVEPIYKNILFPKWNKRQERKILKSADLVITVSEGLKKSLSGLHDHVISVPRGINMRTDEVKKQHDKFTICYTGNLFRHFRDGKFFVECLAKVIDENNLSPENLEFVYAGRDSDRWIKWFEEYGIGRFLVNKGFISRSESLELQLNADILLLLSSSSVEQQGVLTGKFWEYLETINPIINIINGVEDKEFEHIFSELQAGQIFYPKNSESLQDYLLKKYSDFQNGRMEKLSVQAITNRKKLSWKNRSKQILDELFS